MNKNRLILIVGILTLVTPFLGIPNGFQDWMIAFYGLVLISVVLFKYFSSKDDLDSDTEGQNSDYFEEKKAEPTFEESSLEETADDQKEDHDEEVFEENSEEETESEDDRIR